MSFFQKERYEHPINHLPRKIEELRGATDDVLVSRPFTETEEDLFERIYYCARTSHIKFVDIISMDGEIPAPMADRFVSSLQRALSMMRHHTRRNEHVDRVEEILVSVREQLNDSTPRALIPDNL